MDSLRKAENEQTGFELPATCLHTPATGARGVWLEMGDHLGHFMDVMSLSLHIIAVSSNPLPPPNPPNLNPNLRS